MTGSVTKMSLRFPVPFYSSSFVLSLSSLSLSLSLFLSVYSKLINKPHSLSLSTFHSYWRISSYFRVFSPQTESQTSLVRKERSGEKHALKQKHGSQWGKSLSLSLSLSLSRSLSLPLPLHIKSSLFFVFYIV